MDARSGVGAWAWMQVMLATALKARKIGLPYSPDMITDRETNITIGTNYLLALDDFDGSMPPAAAAYNAGPGRPRAWRNGPVLDAAIWAENVPFSETRDYVKKVLANTTNYAAIITGRPQSLRERLGRAWARAWPTSRNRTRTCPESCAPQMRARAFRPALSLNETATCKPCATRCRTGPSSGSTC